MTTTMKKINLLLEKNLSGYKPEFLKSVQAQLKRNKKKKKNEEVLGHNASLFIDRMFEKYYPDWGKKDKA